MADIEPFRGIRYNPSIIDDISRVVTPPYDVISPEAQEAYYARHPHNVVRLILNKESPEDTPRDNRYTRSAAAFKKWRAENILIRDPEPGLYVYTIGYSVENGVQRQRTGLITLVRLEDFRGGRVRRHEKTFSETKSDRLRLLKACRANFSPIFSLYVDPEHVVSGLVNDMLPHVPLADFRDEHGVHHVLRHLTDTRTVDAVKQWFRGKDLFIADGHHRYETALAYWRQLTRKKGPDTDDTAPGYVMMYLSNIHEDLTILPAHRLLARWPASPDPDAFLNLAERHFQVQAYPVPAGRKDTVRAEFLSDLNQAGRSAHAFGFCRKQDPRYFLLTMKPEVMGSSAGKGMRKVLRDLDVVAFTEVIFKQMLGMDKEDLDNEANIHYGSKAHEVLDWVEEGRYSAGFLMNPTRIDQVVAVATAGITMPRKSTYFYPKVLTGIVINAFP